jgi:hypothetical protein
LSSTIKDSVKEELQPILDALDESEDITKLT